jgi:hypothetical protein
LYNKNNKGIKMHTVQLKIDDSIYKNIMFLLNNLNLKGFSIKEENNYLSKENNIDTVFDAISIDTKGFKFDREEANAR